MFPGQRIGVALVPDKIYDEVIRYKQITDIHTNILSQKFLETFIKSGMYKYHKDKILEIHNLKSNILKQGLSRYFSEYNYGVNNKLHTSIELPNNINMTKFHEELEQNKILIDNYKPFYLEGSKDNRKFLKICTMNIEENKIDEGMQMIHRILQKHVSNK